MIYGLLWFSGGGGWCYFFFPLNFVYFSGGGGLDGWLWVVGLSFINRWLLALAGC